MGKKDLALIVHGKFADGNFHQLAIFDGGIVVGFDDDHGLTIEALDALYDTMNLSVSIAVFDGAGGSADRRGTHDGADELPDQIPILLRRAHESLLSCCVSVSVSNVPR